MSIPLTHRKFSSWSDGNSDGMTSLWDYGNKLYQVGIFRFPVEYIIDPVTGYVMGTTGIITGDVDASYLARVDRWPHIRWFLTVRNDGYSRAFRALVLNINEPENPTSSVGCRDTFLNELDRLIDTYPWIAGIDIDLERGPEELTAEVAYLAQLIAERVRAKGKEVCWCLPGRQSDTFPWWESWCDYGAMAPHMDCCAIMTYDFAWAGSAPGATSPRWWLENVYNYAVTRIGKEKIFLGMPGYGYRWQIYQEPDPAYPYRGAAGGYDYAWMNWANGVYSHTDGRGSRPNTQTQPYIPFAPLWDEINCCAYLYLHIYDYLDAYDIDLKDFQVTVSRYDDKPFATCYGKIQNPGYTNLATTREALPYDAIQNEQACEINYTVGYISPLLESPGYDETEVIYNFNIDTAETYDVIVEVVYLWWDQNTLSIVIDGANFLIGDPPYYYPFYRKKHWVKVTTMPFTAGSHQLKVKRGIQSGVQFYGFKVVQGYDQNYSGGEMQFTMRPGKFVDVNGNDAWPYMNKFKATLELLRRPPDYANIWYDQWIGYVPPLPAAQSISYYPGSEKPWYIDAGRWTVNRLYDPVKEEYRDAYYMEAADVHNTGDPQLSLEWDQFSDVYVKTQVCICPNTVDPRDQAGGIRIKDRRVIVNATTQRIEVRDLAGTVLTYYTPSTTIQTGYAWQEGYPLYTLSARSRGTELKVWFEGSHIITTTVASGPGYFGLYAPFLAHFLLLELGHAWIFEPQEAIEVTLPDGITTIPIGREARSGQGYTWIPEYGMFSIDSGEEHTTRTSEISNDYDFFHTDTFELAISQAYPISIKMLDKGIWFSKLYLGDNDGFSVAYYSDADTLLQMMQIANNKQLAGTAMWQLGMEDRNLWRALPDFADPL